MDINEQYREDHQRRYGTMRAVKDMVMAVIFLCVGLLMFFGRKLPALQNFFAERDPLLLYIFGGACLLYGAFRMYIAVKRKY